MAAQQGKEAVPVGMVSHRVRADYGSPYGPKFCRYRMWYTWQSAEHMVLGASEPEVAELLRREITPGNVCIDVGAHAGYFAIHMACLAGKRGSMVAFEPVPVNFDILQKNIALNSLANVRLEPMGVSAHAGTLQFTLDSHQEFPKTGTITGHASGGRLKVMDVPTCTLDSYFAETGRVPDLLLIDVEGAKLDVLKGAEAILKTGRPRLLIELHDWDSSKRDEASEFLSTLGYQRTIIGHRKTVSGTRTLSRAFGFFPPAQAIGTPAQGN